MADHKDPEDRRPKVHAVAVVAALLALTGGFLVWLTFGATLVGVIGWMITGGLLIVIWQADRAVAGDQLEPYAVIGGAAVLKNRERLVFLDLAETARLRLPYLGSSVSREKLLSTGPGQALIRLPDRAPMLIGRPA